MIAEYLRGFALARAIIREARRLRHEYTQEIVDSNGVSWWRHKCGHSSQDLILVCDSCLEKAILDTLERLEKAAAAGSTPGQRPPP